MGYFKRNPFENFVKNKNKIESNEELKIDNNVQEKILEIQKKKEKEK
jgi:hypothetical protein